MTALPQHTERLSPEEYLEGERVSDIRHEYLAGEVYAMAEASAAHNLITLNLATALHTHLRGGPRAVFASDMKVRLRQARDWIFYYPDILVACDPADNAPYWRERPVVIVELLSPETQRTDLWEKLQSYQTIPSLEVYVIISQTRREVILHRRANVWQPEVFTPADAPPVLETLGFTIDFDALYERTGL